VARLGPDTTPR